MIASNNISFTLLSQIECLKRVDNCEGYAFKSDETDSCMIVDNIASDTHLAAAGWTLYLKTRR